MNVNRNYYEMQLEGHPLAPKEVEVTDRQLDRFRELVRRGKGRRDFDDDCYYEGSFAGGEINGKGVYCFNDGSKYTGEFKDGWMHGKGTYVVKSSLGGKKANLEHVFEGDYMLGTREGNGSISYANGITLVGEFRGSRCKGKGKMHFPNGDVYEGEFDKDLPHGRGKYRFTNGSVYVGEFAKGKMNGEGTFEFDEATSYENSEYLLPGMSIPEKLRIPAGQVHSAFVKGQLYEPTLLAPEPDFEALAALDDEEEGNAAAGAPGTAGTEGGAEGGEGGGEGTAPGTAEGDEGGGVGGGGDVPAEGGEPSAE